MARKLEFSEVVGIFEGDEYTLVSTNYVNSRSNVCTVCPSGHLYTTTVERFKRGQRCKKCLAFSLALSFEEVLDRFSSAGLTLCSVSYMNSHSRLRYVCPNGHVRSASAASVVSDKGCLECYTDSFHSTKSFSEFAAEFGYEVVSGEYVNNYTKVELMCPRGHVVPVAPMNFLAGKRCVVCSREGRVTDLSLVEELFGSEGYSVLHYSSASSPVKVKCPSGHTSKMFVYNFRNGHRCRHCGTAGISAISTQWLDTLGVVDREVRVGRYRVDGFDGETNTVYEFLGGFWHGDPRRFDRTGMNPIAKRTFGELLEKTASRLYSINKHHNLVYIWEKEFRSGAQPTSVPKQRFIKDTLVPE